LIRLKVIQALQDSTFGEIELWEAPPEAGVAPTGPGTDTGTAYAEEVAAELPVSPGPEPDATPKFAHPADAAAPTDTADPAAATAFTPPHSPSN